MLPVFAALGGLATSALGYLAKNWQGAASFIYQYNKDRHLTGAQQEANAFTAEQNQKAMDFEASQAQQQMDFQREQQIQVA